MTLKAEINFVSAEQAKELIAVEGYTILDVRDKTQIERAHIKSCYHVPLFVENQDNDLGMEILPIFRSAYCFSYNMILSQLHYSIEFVSP